MYKTIPKHYPEAIRITDLETKIITDLVQKKLDLKSTIWATSFCSDEVNNLFSPFYDLFAGPGPFMLGGISGLPFSGITGMKAFLSHAPSHGAVLVLYGPHIGISEDGKIGQVNRQNQFASSTCCGSLVAALESIKKDEHMPLDNPLDYQQARVIEHLHKNRSNILESQFPLKEATDSAYEAIHTKMNRILDIIKPELDDIKLYLIGGIVINTDWTIEDLFEVRNVEYLEF
ncbi:MAG: hypothetical protein JJ971_13370 [Balneolaceae bacterium]|nr:hypothetical protein [Balneolaceae bacterium]MBO6547154.1 hypothetical protein [Balneolaceae bacterium]MBO6647898.1 hypothetical protein [Balneolaceae bacterium]